MRLDKFLAEQTGLTRSQANKALRQSAVQINGKIEKSGAVKVSAEDEIYFEGQRLSWLESGQYLMLNKPQGYVCSHDEGITLRFINSLITLWQASCTVRGV